MDKAVLKAQLKQLIIEESDKSDLLTPTELQDDEALFGDKSRLHLDSLDALQIAVALKQKFGVDLKGDRAIRKHMQCVTDLADFIEQQQ